MRPHCSVLKYKYKNTLSRLCPIGHVVKILSLSMVGGDIQLPQASS